MIINNRQQYKKYIDKQLKVATSDSYKAIEKLFMNKKFLENVMVGDIEFANMSIIMSIYQDETKKGIQNTILSFNRNMEDLTNIIIDLKFLIWRFQFDDKKIAGEKIEEYLKKNNLSDIVLKHAMRIAFVREDNG